MSHTLSAAMKMSHRLPVFCCCTALVSIVECKYCSSKVCHDTKKTPVDLGDLIIKYRFIQEKYGHFKLKPQTPEGVYFLSLTKGERALCSCHLLPMTLLSKSLKFGKLR